jgi:hypothetical protein
VESCRGFELTSGTITDRNVPNEEEKQTMADPKKTKAKKKTKVMRDLPKRKKTLTIEQAKSVKGGSSTTHWPTF